MLHGASTEIQVTRIIFQNVGMLWALIKLKTSFLAHLVVFHHCNVLLVVSGAHIVVIDRVFCGCVAIDPTDESGVVRHTVFVVRLQVLVDGAIAFITGSVGRVVVIHLLVVEVDVLRLAVWVMESVSIVLSIVVVSQEPHLRLVLCFDCTVMISSSLTLSLEGGASRWRQVV